MYVLNKLETSLVYGGSGTGGTVSELDGGGTSYGGRTKNNNGYGNGAESGPPPGNSGDHNPQLTSWNSGPKGPR